jgi:HPt (histidine-containing phosphotransfer) domain-containing protein
MPTRSETALDMAILDELRSILDPAGLGEVIALYVAEAPRCLDALSTASCDRDRARAAHRLKGAAAGVGAREVASLAREVELLAHARQPSSDQLAGLREAIERSTAALQRLVA